MGVRAFASMYNIPYFALGGEMSDYVGARQIVSYRRCWPGSSPAFW